MLSSVLYIIYMAVLSITYHISGCPQYNMSYVRLSSVSYHIFGCQQYYITYIRLFQYHISNIRLFSVPYFIDGKPSVSYIICKLSSVSYISLSSVSYIIYQTVLSIIYHPKYEWDLVKGGHISQISQRNGPANKFNHTLGKCEAKFKHVLKASTEYYGSRFW